MKYYFLSGIILFMMNACQEPNGVAKQSCTIEGYTQSQLLTLQSEKFANVAAADLNTLALNFIPCVGSANPVMRDEIIYSSLAAMLRRQQLSQQTQVTLFSKVLTLLGGETDQDGFLKPFAALNLSELARADRIEPYLTAEQREEMVRATIGYMSSINDYRGFDNQQGWRHGVAHTADVILQLTLNPNIDTGQQQRLRAALASQIVPQNGHSYIYGEPERLARPILYMARRGDFDAKNWSEWFAGITNPAPLESWQDVYKSQAGLAKLHNTKEFLNVLYINASESQNENIKQIFTPVREALAKLP